MTIKISQELRDRFASVAEGRSIDDLREHTFTGRIEVPEQQSNLTAEETKIVSAAASSIEQAGGPKLVSNGVPTIMRLVAWMCHEGRNNNGLIFLESDLGAAADRIREPNFLILDWNHSSVLSFSYDPKSIGLWYRAEKRWDPKAKQGSGAWGILAQG